MNINAGIVLNANPRLPAVAGGFFVRGHLHDSDLLFDLERRMLASARKMPREVISFRGVCREVLFRVETAGRRVSQAFCRVNPILHRILQSGSGLFATDNEFARILRNSQSKDSHQPIAGG